MCLVDRLKASIPNATEAELLRLDKLAQTIVFTSQGVPFMFNGEEVFRNKKGVHNSFDSPDSINAIDWSLKSKYKDLFDYYKGLIALRKAHPAFRIGRADVIREKLKFLPTTRDNVIAYVLNNHASFIGIGLQFFDVEVRVGGQEVKNFVFRFTEPVFPTNIPTFDQQLTESIF